MAKNYEYPALRRAIDGTVRVFYRFCSGFNQGLSFAILFSAVMIPANLLHLAIGLGISFGITWMIKEIYTVVKRNKREALLLEQLKLKQYALNHAQSKPVNQHERKFFKQYYQHFVKLKRAYAYFINVIQYAANGLSVFGLIFFFIPSAATTFPAVQKILISLASALGITALGLVYKYFVRRKLKSRVYEINKYRSRRASVALKHSDPKKYQEVFSPLSKWERRFYTFGGPFFEFILSVFQGVTSTFGILLMFCIGINISLPWITPVSALIGSIMIGMAIAFRETINIYQKQAGEIAYIDEAVRTQAELDKHVPSYYLHQQTRRPVLDQDCVPNSKLYLEHAFRTRMNQFFEYLSSFISGASSGIGFSSAVVSILFLLSVPTGGGGLFIIFAVGALFGCINIYREHFTKSIQSNQIDQLEHRLRDPRKIFDRVDSPDPTRPNSMEDESDATLSSKRLQFFEEHHELTQKLSRSLSCPGRLNLKKHAAKAHQENQVPQASEPAALDIDPLPQHASPSA